VTVWFHRRVAERESELGVLLAGARTGSASAFEGIYRELAAPVASYLRWSGASDVDGLTNEVMANVHRGLPRFKGDWSAFRSWVFTIAHHRLIDARRAEHRRPVSVAEVTEDHAGVGDAEDDVLHRLGDERVTELLATLSSAQREVLLLRVVADLSLEDVAAALGKPIGAVKSLQHRALAALRRTLSTEVIER
jgi:RNA polymerase sigma-70 factor (ECF subfamily)